VINTSVAMSCTQKKLLIYIIDGPSGQVSITPLPSLPTDTVSADSACDVAKTC
jgi:hypothetical protein